MNCKKDGLAFIKKALRENNIGKIVTCKQSLGYVERGKEYSYNGERWVAPDSDTHWVITCPSGLDTQFGKAAEAIIADSWMTPIDPDILNSDEDTLIIDRIDEFVL